MSLSDKIYNRSNSDNIKIEDVKEFIKELKEHFTVKQCVCVHCKWCKNRIFIDKLAGDKLI